MKQYLLPVGTIVQLKRSTKLLMIIGRFPVIKQNSQIGYYEYSACLYPSGFYGENLYMFNQSDIHKVIHYGYFSLEEMDLVNHINENMEALKGYHHFK